MAARRLERVISGTQRGLPQKRDTVLHNIENLEQEDPPTPVSSQPSRLQPTEALNVFFDRIPVSSIPGIKNNEVLELSSTDCMGDAIIRLYTENVMGAPVRDQLVPDANPLRDRYIGLVDFSGMVLWALHEFEAAEVQSKNRGLVLSNEAIDLDVNIGHTGTGTAAGHTAESGFQTVEAQRYDFFGTLEQFPSVRLSKIQTMSRSFRWGPYLPVTLEDTLLHVLLLLSKHRLKAVPVVDQDEQQVRGFITQDAAVQLLLQCSGLEWFDIIAEKKLSEFRFEMEDSKGHIVQVFSDDSIQNAMICMWKYRLSGVPVIDRKTAKLIGNVRSTDVRLLVEKPELFNQRRVLSIEEFLKVDAGLDDASLQDRSLEKELGACIPAATLSLGNISFPRMREPVTSTRSDILKTTMEKLVRSRSDRCFLVDDKLAVTGVITLRDIIIQFAPLYVDGPDQCGGFFQTALQQTGLVMQSRSLLYADTSNNS